MLQNYLKIAVRNLARHRMYSAINVFGLAVGMTCCLLILVFVQYELSYDRFHTKADQIYRVMRGNTPRMPAPVAPLIQADYPDIQVVRLLPRFQNPVHVNHQHFKDDIAFVDASFFNVFTFPLIKGDDKTALKAPYTAVISETIAQKYFGQADPIGQMLKIDVDHLAEYRITGIMRDMPVNSHFEFDVLTSFESLYDFLNAEITSRESGRYTYTYALLPEGRTETFRDYLRVFGSRYSEGLEADYRFDMMPLTQIHLYSQPNYQLKVNGDINQVYLFSSVAGLVLLIACFNFMNLATARSAHRAREVGMRKVAGAYRAQLMGQFLGESVLLSVGALVLAVALTEVFIPVLGGFLGRDLMLVYNSWQVLFGLTSIAVGVGVLAGVYPALFLSGFQPAEVLKGRFGSTRKGVGFRRVLVVVQFAISVVLVVATGIVMQQKQFVRDKNLGFDKDHVVVIRSASGVVPQDIDRLRKAFLQHPNVRGVSASTGIPGRRTITHTVYLKAGGEAEQTRHGPKLIMADEDFIDTYNIEMLSGRNFDPNRAEDKKNWVFLINETAVEMYGWRDPIGKDIVFSHNRGGGKVIGIVKDFHFASLHTRVQPLIIAYRVPWVSYISVKIGPDNVANTLALLEETWRTLHPDLLLDSFFLDEQLNQLYRAEERMGTLLGMFSSIAILISCLGLFGLAAFTVERRTKEIGIRKVLGASVSQIVLLLSKEFAWLVLVANVIAWPLAFWSMRAWLENFAYRVAIDPAIFLIGGVLALIIALLTVSFHAIKAAQSNPVEALKVE